MPPSVICATLFGFYKLLTDERIEIHCGSCVPTSPKTFRREVERLSSFVVERLEYRSLHASIRCERGRKRSGVFCNGRANALAASRSNHARNHLHAAPML